MDAALLGVAIMMGLTGSLHCAGMCGPIMLVLPFAHYDKVARALAMVLYHAGRISVYMAMAVVLHSFKHLFHPEWQQRVSIVAGVLLLLFGFFSFVQFGHRPIKMPWSQWVQQRMKNILSQPSISTMTLLGMLNGLLPCGLVYMALSASMSAQGYWISAAFMGVFGLGTAPMLIAISLLKNKITGMVSLSMRRFVPLIICLFGVLILLRGMNLGIPYISPKVETQAEGKVKAKCCSKK